MDSTLHYIKELINENKRKQKIVDELENELLEISSIYLKPPIEISELPEWVFYVCADSNGNWYGFEKSEIKPDFSKLGWSSTGKSVLLGTTNPIKTWYKTLSLIGDLKVNYSH